MTPSTPSPDTGAGTPLTAREARNALLGTLQDEGIVGRKRQRIEDAADRFATATLDAARPRPATDPAGLDAAVREFNAFLWSYDEDDHPHASNELKRRWLVVAARLSVADGPGPEERLR